MHDDESLIIEMLEKNKQSQLSMLEELRLMGDFQHNIEVFIINYFRCKIVVVQFNYFPGA